MNSIPMQLQPCCYPADERWYRAALVGRGIAHFAELKLPPRWGEGSR